MSCTYYKERSIDLDSYTHLIKSSPLYIRVHQAGAWLGNW